MKRKKPAAEPEDMLVIARRIVEANAPNLLEVFAQLETDGEEETSDWDSLMRGCGQEPDHLDTLIALQEQVRQALPPHAHEAFSQLLDAQSNGDMHGRDASFLLGVAYAQLIGGVK